MKSESVEPSPPLGPNMKFWGDHTRSQMCTKLPYPTEKFTGQTIIVTGSNIGMGLEAVRHFVRLDAAKVILAVRSIAKGEAAAADVVKSTGRAGVVQVWEMDLSSYDSVKAFARRVNTELDRLDVFIGNAAKYTWTFERAEGEESTITVNVLSTLLLSILVLPKLRETSAKLGKTTVLSTTGSFVHFMTLFPERHSPKIFEELSKEDKARMNDRYNVSKMIQLLLSRELAARAAASSQPGKVAISTINPGHVRTSIMRETKFLDRLWMEPLHRTMGRPTEEGGRTLVYAAYGGDETNGQYLSDCKIGTVSAWVPSPEGKDTQNRLWLELSEKLEQIQPGIMETI